MWVCVGGFVVCVFVVCVFVVCVFVVCVRVRARACVYVCVVCVVCVCVLCVLCVLCVCSAVGVGGFCCEGQARSGTPALNPCPNAQAQNLNLGNVQD